MMATEKNYFAENSKLKIQWFFNSKKLSKFILENKLTDKKIVSVENSEEFVISFKKGLFKYKIASSELKLKSYDNSLQGEHIFTFKDIKVKGVKLTIKLIYVLKQEDAFIRKYLEIDSNDEGKEKLILDYVDFERVSVNAGDVYWSVPKQKRYTMPPELLECGQPIYLNSFYMGLEFPISYTKIENALTTVRYYSGKSISQLADSAPYKTHYAVIGVASGTTIKETQKAFFEYIATISKSLRLRRQYNSWFDNMLNITRENLYDSFLNVEKGITKSGEKALDCYVADDGWNDYKADFWSFNEKFPDKLYPFTSLTQALGSNFGLWLGPRGGYTNDTIKFAKQIEKAGNGFVNKKAHDICVASEKYIEKVSSLMLDYQRDFNLTYWKLDGFAQQPCKNKKHDHMVGGFNNMYFYTNLWEKWVSVFEKLSCEQKQFYWINLTCYAPASPWFLMYVNSLWMQVSLDVGFIGKQSVVSDKDRMLSYRDETYFDFCEERQYQFPISRLYNHDPIYGNEAKVSMTDDEFREYLFTMAMRGTSFWELYYSYRMMNEAKWKINYSVLRFIEDNLSLLSTSVIFGDRPSTNGVYGFACFKNNEALIGVRNSSSENKEYTFVIDEKIGAKKNTLLGPATRILPYSGETQGKAYAYGDHVKLSLKPYETQILHFGRKFKIVEAQYVKAIDSKTLEVTFNQFVNVSKIRCESNAIINAKLLDDYMSVQLTFSDAFGAINELKLDAVCDIIGNDFSAIVKFDYYEDNIVTQGLYSKGEFSIKANVDTNDEHELYSQGNEVVLKITEQGLVSFKVGYNTLVSNKDISEIVQIVAVREKNGVLKLYINGELDSGLNCPLYELSGTAGVKRNDKVILYNKAFAFDEV